VLDVIVQARELGVKTRLSLNLNIIKVLSHHWSTTLAQLAQCWCTIVAQLEHHWSITGAL